MKEVFSPVGGASKTMSIIMLVSSVVLYLFFIITGIVCLAYGDDRAHVLSSYYPNTKFITYLGFQMDQVTLIITIVILICLALTVLVFLCLRGCVIKDGGFYDAYFGKWTRFFPIVLLFNSVLFLLGHFYKKDNNMNNIAITGLVFAILSTALLVFIYIQTNFGDSIKGFIVKKCLFSALMCFNFYYIFYTISYLSSTNKNGYRVKLSKAEDCSVGFGVVFGILCLPFIFFFRDIIFGVIALLVFIGLLAFRCDDGLIEKHLLHDDDKIVGGVFVAAICLVIIGTFIYNRNNLKKILD